jgi:hypothetical protein
VSAAAPPASHGAEARPGAGRAVVVAVGRGITHAFLPVAVAGQALAWTMYAVTHAYRPWSWLKIGLAYTLSSAHVAFDVSVAAATPSDPTRAVEAELAVALGGFVILAVVMLFRAGRDAERSTPGDGAMPEDPPPEDPPPEDPPKDPFDGRVHGHVLGRPVHAALIGGLVGIGFAVPCAIASMLVRLSFPPSIGALRPVVWQALAWPFVVGVLVGAVGAVSATRWANRFGGGERIAEAARGAWSGFLMASTIAFAGFLLLAAIEARATSAYARGIGRQGAVGAVILVHHALLLPNQASMILSTSMGVPTQLSIDGEAAARVSLGGVDTVGDYGAFAGAYLGFRGDHLSFPWWYRAFVLAPAVGTLVGGRRAAVRAPDRREAIVRATVAGVGFAVLSAAAAWIAAIALPAVPTGATIRLAASASTTLLVGLPWGIVGGVLGSQLPGGLGPGLRFRFRDEPR